MTEFREWIQVIIPGLNLMLILFGLIRVFSKHEAEWREKELRLHKLETAVDENRTALMKIIAIEVSLKELVSETERLRDRLDKFLDSRLREEGL